MVEEKQKWRKQDLSSLMPHFSLDKYEKVSANFQAFFMFRQLHTQKLTIETLEQGGKYVQN